MHDPRDAATLVVLADGLDLGQVAVVADAGFEVRGVAVGVVGFVAALEVREVGGCGWGLGFGEGAVVGNDG